MRPLMNTDLNPFTALGRIKYVLQSRPSSINVSKEYWNPSSSKGRCWRPRAEELGSWVSRLAGTTLSLFHTSSDPLPHLEMADWKESKMDFLSYMSTRKYHHVRVSGASEEEAPMSLRRRKISQRVLLLRLQASGLINFKSCILISGGP